MTVSTYVVFEYRQYRFVDETFGNGLALTLALPHSTSLPYLSNRCYVVLETESMFSPWWRQDNVTLWEQELIDLTYSENQPPQIMFN